MALYELMLILKSDLDADKVNSILEKAKSLLQEKNGTLVRQDLVGKKLLATHFDKNQQGIYALLVFNGNKETNVALIDHFKLNENVVRFLLKKQEVESAAAAKKRTRKAKNKADANGTMPETERVNVEMKS